MAGGEGEKTREEREAKRNDDGQKQSTETGNRKQDEEY